LGILKKKITLSRIQYASDKSCSTSVNKLSLHADFPAYLHDIKR